MTEIVEAQPHARFKHTANLAAELSGYKEACEAFWKARSVWDKWEGNRTPDPNESEFSQQIRANYWGALQSAEARCNEHWRQAVELWRILSEHNPDRIAKLRFIQVGETRWHLSGHVIWYADGIAAELATIYGEALDALENAPPIMVDVAEAHKRIGLSTSQIRRLCEDGKLAGAIGGNGKPWKIPVVSLPPKRQARAKQSEKIAGPKRKKTAMRYCNTCQKPFTPRDSSNNCTEPECGSSNTELLAPKAAEKRR
jgi:hypothetical protein